MQINLLVENPEAHVLALTADGFKEEPPKKRISSWPTRCLVKSHNGGLLVETQHVDMSRPPVDLRSSRHQAPVIIDIAVNVRAMRKLLDNMKQFKKRSKELSAFLSEYRPAIELLKQVDEAELRDPKLEDVRTLLGLVSTRRIYQNQAP